MYRAAFSDRIDELEEFFLAHDDGEQFDNFLKSAKLHTTRRLMF